MNILLYDCMVHNQIFLIGRKQKFVIGNDTSSWCDGRVVFLRVLSLGPYCLLSMSAISHKWHESLIALFAAIRKILVSWWISSYAPGGLW